MTEDDAGQACSGMEHGTPVATSQEYQDAVNKAVQASYRDYLDEIDDIIYGLDFDRHRNRFIMRSPFTELPPVMHPKPKQNQSKKELGMIEADRAKSCSESIAARHSVSDSVQVIATTRNSK